MVKEKKYLCKRTLTIGSRNMLTEGKRYDVVYNKNDKNDTFSIIDDQNCVHLFFMYKDEDDYNLPRTYSKWFYTCKELRKLKLEKINGT